MGSPQISNPLGQDGKISLKPEEPSRAEALYGLVRDYMKHEDKLVQDRTSWLVTVQSFLLTTFGLSVQKRLEVLAAHPKASPDELRHYGWFLFMLMVVGLATSLVSLISIRAAVKAGEALERWWAGMLCDHSWLKYLPPVMGGGDAWARHNGVKLQLYLPRMFLVLWSVVIFYALCIYMKVSFKIEWP